MSSGAGCRLLRPNVGISSLIPCSTARLRPGVQPPRRRHWPGSPPAAPRPRRRSPARRNRPEARFARSPASVERLPQFAEFGRDRDVVPLRDTAIAEVTVAARRGHERAGAVQEQAGTSVVGQVDDHRVSVDLEERRPGIRLRRAGIRHPEAVKLVEGNKRLQPSSHWLRLPRGRIKLQGGGGARPSDTPGAANGSPDTRILVHPSGLREYSIWFVRNHGHQPEVAWLSAILVTPGTGVAWRSSWGRRLTWMPRRKTTSGRARYPWVQLMAARDSIAATTTHITTMRTARRPRGTRIPGSVVVRCRHRGYAPAGVRGSRATGPAAWRCGEGAVRPRRRRPIRCWRRPSGEAQQDHVVADSVTDGAPQGEAAVRVGRAPAADHGDRDGGVDE